MALNQIKHLQTKKEKLDSDTLIEIVKYREIQLKKDNNFVREISFSFFSSPASITNNKIRNKK